MLLRWTLAFAVFYTSCAHSPLFDKNNTPTLISADFKFTEGPAVAPNGDVYFTDQPNDRIMRWDAETNTISTFMENSGRSNGLYFDHDGSLLACADEKFQLWRIDKNGDYEVVLDNYKSQSFNGPNDLWVDQSGGIYFTDPYYQRPYWTRKKGEMESQNVYYLPKGAKEAMVVAENFVKPNGIIGSSDDEFLFVADIGDKKTYRFPILGNGILGERKLIINKGSDGMTLDHKGNIYLTGDGVMVFDSSGNQIGHIPIPSKWTANVTFGGPKEEILFITASDAVYILPMKVHGVRYR